MTARRMKGAWWVDFRFDRRRVRRKSPVDTKRGAEEFERTLRSRLLAGQPLEGDDAHDDEEVPRYAAFAEEWMKVYVATNNKPSEVASKRKILRLHLVPFFGAWRLDEISTRRIEQFKASQQEKRYAAKTINNQLTVLRRSLDCAAEWELLEGVPRIKWLKAQKPAFDFLTRQESDRLLAAACADDLPMVATALKAGLRRGELLALRWQDVDFDAGLITVRHAVSEGVVTSTKSGRSRSVPMSPELARILRGHRHLRGPWVFCADDGARLSRDQVKRHVPRTCLKAGLRCVQWHTLRHSFASQLVMAGVPLRAVQELLGHATIEMTMRYAHLAPDSLSTAVAVLDGAHPMWAPGGHRPAIPSATTRDR